MVVVGVALIALAVGIGIDLIGLARLGLFGIVRLASQSTSCRVEALNAP